MNKKIKELCIKSGAVVLPGSTGIFINSLDPEKFAKLIIQECCSLLENMGNGWQEFADNPPKGQEHNASAALFTAYRLREDSVDEIREHFGIE